MNKVLIVGCSHTLLLIAALRDVAVREPPEVLSRERLVVEQETFHPGELHRSNTRTANSKRSRIGKRERWN